MKPALEPLLSGAIVFIAVQALLDNLALSLACTALSLGIWALYFASQIKRR